MPPKRNGVAKGVKAKAYQQITIDAQGLTVTDLFKKKWLVGTPVGTGGFGTLYQATDVSNGTGSEYVIKIEPHDNGPLFTELSFYQRRAKKESVQAYMSTHKLKKLGMPLYISSGLHEVGKCKYRFMIIPQYRTDLQKLFIGSNKKFPLKIVLTVALQVLEVLQYIHTHDYVHADIKAANLLLGLHDPNQAYLVDYGLARVYSSGGKHQPYKPDPKLAHDGTIEFTSRDAHAGCAPSRRGDLEILGYCCMQWLLSQLPWETCLNQPEKVAQQKGVFMKKSSLEKLSPEVPRCLIDYMTYVSQLQYDETPDYSYIKKCLTDGMKKEKISLDGKLDFSSVLASGKAKKRKSDASDPTPKKRRSASASKPSTSQSATPKAGGSSKAKTSAAKGKTTSRVKSAANAKSKSSSSKVLLTDLISDSDDDVTLSSIANKNNSSRKRKSIDPRALKVLKKAKSSTAGKKPASKVSRAKPARMAAVKGSLAMQNAISPQTAAALKRAKASAGSTSTAKSPRLNKLQTTIATQTSPSLAGLKGRRKPK